MVLVNWHQDDMGQVSSARLRDPKTAADALAEAPSVAKGDQPGCSAEAPCTMSRARPAENVHADACLEPVLPLVCLRAAHELVHGRRRSMVEGMPTSW